MIEFVEEVKNYMNELGFGYMEIGLVFSLKTFEFKDSGFIKEIYLTDAGLELSRVSEKDFNEHKEAANWTTDVVVEL